MIFTVYSSTELFANIILRSSLQQYAAVDLFVDNMVRSSIDLSTLTNFASIDLFVDNMVRSNITAAQNRLDDHSSQQYRSINVNDLRSSLQRLAAVDLFFNNTIRSSMNSSALMILAVVCSNTQRWIDSSTMRFAATSIYQR